MLESAWLFVGFLALVFTILALLTQSQVARTFGNADGIAIVVGAIGTILWGVFAYGSLDVTVVDGGVSFQFTMPTITITAIAIALVPAYVALTGPAEMIEARWRDMEPEDY